MDEIVADRSLLQQQPSLYADVGDVDIAVVQKFHNS